MWLVDVVVPLVGVLVLAVVGWDISVAVLHPSAHGPFSPLVAKTVWRIFRRLAALRGGAELLTFAGPLAILANLIAWTTGVWLGFALLYAPFMTAFNYAAGIPFGDRGFLDALYASGVSLTTVGFGDVVAETYWLRFATVAEAASGLALITAAISFVLSVYPGLTSMRSDARRFSDLRLADADVAVRLVGRDAESILLDLHQALVTDEQQRQRFPVRLFFPDASPAESRAVLFRCALVVCLAARATGGARDSQTAAAALERTLLRTMSQYERALLGGEAECATIPDSDVRRQRDRLRARADATPAGGSPDDSLEAFAHVLRRGEAFLTKLDLTYCYQHEPLLAPSQ